MSGVNPLGFFASFFTTSGNHQPEPAKSALTDEQAEKIRELAIQILIEKEGMTREAAEEKVDALS